MDLRSAQDYRLVQVFVSENGVFETYIALGENKFACTCPGFRARSWCKHCEFITERAKDGYALELVTHHRPLTDEISEDAEKFREWVIRNTKVMEI